MANQNFVENYGYVPFYSFQWVILGIQVYMIYNYKYVNELMDKIFDVYNSEKQQLKKMILSIPLLLMIYYDIRYSSFSFKNLGFDPAYNNTIKQVLNILGSYAIIHIFAEDTGLKTTNLQTNFLQSHTLFIFISVGMSYSITQNRSQSILALLLFYHLKFVISQNVVDEK
jgi:hypothetical protein